MTAPSNSELARQLRDRAKVHDGHSQHRRALLVAGVLLDSTKTVTSARRELAKTNVPNDLRDRAAAVLDQVATTTRTQTRTNTTLKETQ
ncbi:hypothetical protein [Nocardiopsis nanhaiensis]